MSISLQQQMNAILSVNCALVSALQRLLGDQFFAVFLRSLYKTFEEQHQIVLENNKEADTAKDKVKNIINCFLHFFIFQSLSSVFLFDIIKTLLTTYTEADIETLIFLLHNIGLQLRKADPIALRDIITLSEQKKNSYSAEIKLANQGDQAQIDAMKRKERKIGFLAMELADIKNNKGTMTLQIKSIEHLQTWIKKN